VQFTEMLLVGDFVRFYLNCRVFCWCLGGGLSLSLDAVTDMAFTGRCGNTLGVLLYPPLSLRWHFGVWWREAVSRVVKELFPPLRANVAHMASVV
jgi:hypothetical protein